MFEIIKKRGKDGGEKGTLANLRSEKMVAMSICFAFALHTFSNSPIDNIEVTKGQVQILFVQQERTFACLGKSTAPYKRFRPSFRTKLPVKLPFRMLLL